MARVSISCPGCGQSLETAADDPRAEIECLWCGTKVPLSGRRQRKAPSPVATAVTAVPPSAAPSTAFAAAGPSSPKPQVAVAPPVASTASRAGDEDDEPLRMEAPLDIPCPGCGRALPPEAVLCPSCGYDQKTGGRAQRTYEPLQRTWVAGWPFARRFQLFLLTQAIGVSLAYLGALLAGSIVAFLAPWLIYTAVTAFLLGTYDRVDLTRNERGKVILRHTWRVFFVARPTERIRLAGYEGVATGRRPSGDFWDWLICIILFFAGIVPGVLWWYFIILHDTFYVALTKDHGHADRTLYRDWNDSAAKELATTLRNVGFAGLGD